VKKNLLELIPIPKIPNRDFLYTLFFNTKKHQMYTEELYPTYKVRFAHERSTLPKSNYTQTEIWFNLNKLKLQCNNLNTLKSYPLRHRCIGRPLPIYTRSRANTDAKNGGEVRSSCLIQNILYSVPVYRIIYLNACFSSSSSGSTIIQKT